MVLSRTVIQIRCSDVEKARWTRQAGSRTLTDYLKFLADSDGVTPATEGGFRDCQEPASLGPYITTGPLLPPEVNLEPPSSPSQAVLSVKRSFVPDWKVPIVKNEKGRR